MRHELDTFISFQLLLFIDYSKKIVSNLPLVKYLCNEMAL